MICVMDDKMEVLVVGKVDGKLNLIDVVDFYRVGGEVVYFVGVGLVVLGYVCFVLVEGGYD